MILSLIFLGCSNNASNVKDDKTEHQHHDSEKPVTSLTLNNGVKWKADEATQRNVAVLVKAVNDTGVVSKENKVQLAKQIQTGVDSLVKQCRMQGPDHDALHLWLEQVLKDLKKLKKEDDDDFRESYANLKRNVESFYTFFE